MTNLILLDAGPLGLITHPRGGEDARLCKNWFQDALRAGDRIRGPAIADYEVRRELIRAGKTAGLERLDQLIREIGYVPLVEEAMRTAAELWADSRRRGHPTAPAEALDADCLLAGQARTFLKSNRIHRWVRFTRRERGEGLTVAVAIATTNAGHLGRYANVIEIPSPAG